MDIRITRQRIAQTDKLDLNIVVEEENIRTIVDNRVVRGSKRLTRLRLSTFIVIDGIVYIKWDLEGFDLDPEDTAASINEIRSRGESTYGNLMCFDQDGDFCFAMGTDGTMYVHDDDGGCHSADVVWAIRNDLRENLVVMQYYGSIDLLYRTGYRYCTMENRFHSETDYGSDSTAPGCCRKSGTWNYRDEWIDFVTDDSPVIDDSPLKEQIQTELDWLADAAREDS